MRLKICPSCKKSGIEMFAGFQTGTYRCRCGYVGPVVVEVERPDKSRRKIKPKIVYGD